MYTSTETAAVRAYRGYRWLIENGPTYQLNVNHINPATLDVDSHRACPLAQASNGHTYGLVLARVRGVYDDPTWALDHGFCARDPYDSEPLNVAWQRLVRPVEQVAA